MDGQQHSSSARARAQAEKYPLRTHAPYAKDPEMRGSNRLKLTELSAEGAQLFDAISLDTCMYL